MTTDLKMFHKEPDVSKELFHGVLLMVVAEVLGDGFVRVHHLLVHALEY